MHMLCWRQQLLYCIWPHVRVDRSALKPLWFGGGPSAADVRIINSCLLLLHKVQPTHCIFKPQVPFTF